MAASVGQAFTMGRLFDIDLIVADVVLREGNSAETVQRIAAVRPEVEVLFVSEYSRWRCESLLPAGGRHAFLQTPFSSAALLDAVAALVPDHGYALANIA
jgi:DNA-binding NtrC family response regulator